MRTVVIEPPDNHLLSAAVGWIELGNPLEAFDELERMNSRYRFHPDVLIVRWILYAKARKWEHALDIAKALIKLAPERPMGWIYHAFTLHELKRTFEAWIHLLPAARKFPDNAAIPFNLACYACKLGNLPEAKKWLSRSIEVGGREKIQDRVDKNPELQPLWTQITPAPEETETRRATAFSSHTADDALID